MDNRRAVDRILGINALAILGGLGAQLALLCTSGNSPLMGAYSIGLVVLLGVCLACKSHAPRNPDRALIVYGWGAFLIIAGMVVLDAVYYPDTLPSLMYAPIVGVIAIGALIGYRHMTMYAGANFVFMVIVGVYYGNAREVLTPALICCIAATTAVVIAEKFDLLLAELLALREMIEAFKKTRSIRSGEDRMVPDGESQAVGEH